MSENDTVEPMETEDNATTEPTKAEDVKDPLEGEAETKVSVLHRFRKSNET